MAQHRAQGRTHRARWATLITLSVLAILYMIGAQQEDTVPTMVTCTAEDGSTPAQAFPCVWDAQAQGNHLGQSYVLYSAR